MSLTQLYNFFHFDDVSYLLRGLGLFIVPFSCFFFQEKGMLFYGSIIATFFLYLSDFNNYTSLWFILACNRAAPDKKKSLYVYIWYAAHSIIYFTFWQSAFTQALFHLSFAALMTLLNYHCNSNGIKKHKRLSITPEEYKILWQLTAEGKQQKELDLYNYETFRKRQVIQQNKLM